MPWFIEEQDSEYCVVKGERGEDGNETLKCYSSRDEALKYLRALEANEPEGEKAIDAETPLAYKAVDLSGAEPVDTEVNGVKGWTANLKISTFGVKDREGDATVEGCFDRGWRETGKPVVKEEHGRVVGKVLDAWVAGGAQWVGAFFPQDQATDFLRKLMKVGAVAKCSYGWRPYPGGTKAANGVRELRDIWVPEVTVCAIPMLHETAITDVKGLLPTGYDGPVSELLTKTGLAVLTAVAEAEALQRRRADEGRSLTDAQAEAIYDLGTKTAGATIAMVELAGKIGKAEARPRKRLLVDVIRALDAFIGALPERERDELQSLLKDVGKSASEDDKKSAESAVADPRTQLEADIIRAQLRRHGR